MYAVRFRSPLPKQHVNSWTRSSIGRALPCHGRGSEIETRRVRQIYEVSGGTSAVSPTKHARSSGTGVAPTKRDDEGSTPSLGSITWACSSNRVEHLFETQGVASSSLARPTIYLWSRECDGSTLVCETGRTRSKLVRLPKTCSISSMVEQRLDRGRLRRNRNLCWYH